MNASIRMSGESRIARMAGMMVTWLQNTEKLRMPSALARISVSAVEGAVVSKPMAKNMTCRSGIGARQLQRIGRRIDDADVGAAGLVLERAAVRAGHAHHVAKGGEDHVGLRRRWTGRRRCGPSAARRPGSPDRGPVRCWAAADP